MTETKSSKEIYDLVYEEINNRKGKLDEKVMKKLWLPADKSILIEDVEKIVDETALAFISVDGVIAVKLYKKELKQKLKEKCT